ncbi:hypothetical protein GQ457_09G029200 [Hibiscus cannabinus]
MPEYRVRDESNSENSDDDQPIRGTRLLSDVYERCSVAVLEPTDFEEAFSSEGWKKAMQNEITKLNADGSVNQLKARLVVKGYAQQFGVDYSETFAPVARLDTIRLLLALAAQIGWKIHQLDVKSAFLNGFFKEEIYIEQPQGFVVEGNEAKVYRLKKLYMALSKHSEPGSTEKLLVEFKKQIESVFEMSDLGEMTYFLGMEVQQSQQDTFISQQGFSLKILKKFYMENCKSVTTPIAQGEKLSSKDDFGRVNEKIYKSLIGCLLYLTATRPDIMFAVSLLSRFMHCCNVSHFKAAKRVLRYIKGTSNYGVWFKKVEKLSFIGYTDSDWAGSIDDMKSTFGYFFTLGYGVFSWSSKKQDTVAQSTTEA